MFEQLTERARKVMSLARLESERLNAEFIGTEHILLGIIQEGGGVAAKVLKNLDVDLKRIRQAIEKLITRTTSPRVRLGQLPFSPRTRRVIELAGEAAGRLGHDAIGTEHLLLGLLEEREGIAAQALTNLGLKFDEVRDWVLEVLGADIGVKTRAPLPTARPEETDLSAWARQETYRHLEDRPSVQDSILSALRQGKSVALVGPEYVGKTSLVLALARAKAGEFRYRSIDYRMFDEFHELKLRRSGRSRTVLVMPEGELFAASRTLDAGLLADRQKRGEPLLLEFREGGFEDFAARYPVMVRDLASIRVDAPDERESRALLEAARSRLCKQTGLGLSDSSLEEATRLAAGSVSGTIMPWSAVLALWEAVPIEEKLRTPKEVRQLEAEIAQLEREKDEAISLQEFEKAAATRDRAMELCRRVMELKAAASRAGAPEISIESVRLAIKVLARRADSP